jgi:hypothetical protein
MATTLPAGAFIRIRCGDQDAPAGAVVAFVHGQRLMAHRVVRRGRGPRAAAHVLTRGDAFAVCDPPIPVTTVLGRVTAWRPGADGPWSPPAGPPARGPVAVALDALIGGLLDLHPALARWVAARALWLRNRFLGLARRLP